MKYRPYKIVEAKIGKRWVPVRLETVYEFRPGKFEADVILDNGLVKRIKNDKYIRHVLNTP